MHMTPSQISDSDRTDCRPEMSSTLFQTLVSTYFQEVLCVVRSKFNFIPTELSFRGHIPDVTRHMACIDRTRSPKSPYSPTTSAVVVPEFPPSTSGLLPAPYSGDPRPNPGLTSYASLKSPEPSNVRHSQAGPIMSPIVWLLAR